MFYNLIRPFLFSLPPETAHNVSLKSLSWLNHFSNYKYPIHHSVANKTIMSLNFPNKIGLAAGLDKNGEYILALANLGFGFIEVGTVTPKPQPGNPKPRLFRIPQAQAIINRMGFNNHGVDALIKNIQRANFKGILGINIGKNATTPLENAAEDYAFCLQKVYPYASYITVNISSPNTPGLRQLQNISDLNKLLATLKKKQIECQDTYLKYVPLIIKISPDVDQKQLEDIANSLLIHSMDGVVATNTTLSRHIVSSLPHAQEVGGLSGKPLFQTSFAIVQTLSKYLNNKIPIIACGGISSVEDAEKMLKAGASLIQIYTGLIYQGPDLIKNLIKATR